MQHSQDDDVHKIIHKMTTHCQFQLKMSVLVEMPNRIRYKKIDVTLVQYPFNVCFNKSKDPPIPNRSMVGVQNTGPVVNMTQEQVLCSLNAGATCQQAMHGEGYMMHGCRPTYDQVRTV